MKKYTRGEKVYILKKSYGDTLDDIFNRAHSVNYERERIEYNGIKLNVLVGYYSYLKNDFKRHVISYVYSLDGGDFYLEGDFISEFELNQIFVIPDEMWELEL